MIQTLLCHKTANTGFNGITSVMPFFYVSIIIIYLMKSAEHSVSGNAVPPSTVYNCALLQKSKKVLTKVKNDCTIEIRTNVL